MPAEIRLSDGTTFKAIKSGSEIREKIGELVRGETRGAEKLILPIETSEGEFWINSFQICYLRDLAE
jgi:hypothetical protein